jgi:hypothetical protein
VTVRDRSSPGLMVLMARRLSADLRPGGTNLGERSKPNRISSSGRHGSEWFRLDQRARSVLRVRRCTALNCNPNCNPQIRRLRQVVQDRLLPSARWADIPQMSTRDRRCPPDWQQYRQQSRPSSTDPRRSATEAGHIPSWRGSRECYGLSQVAAGSRWSLPLLSPLLSVAAQLPLEFAP